MTDLTLRPWRSGDEDAFAPRRDFAEERSAVAWPWARGRAPGPTWTLLRGEEVVGIGGVVDRGGHLQAWASLADLPRREWPAAIARARRALDYVQEGYGLCVAATARFDNCGACRVLERLGFAFVSTAGDERVPGVTYAHFVRRP